MMLLLTALLAALAPQKTPDQELSGPAASCGSEIPWLDSISEAQKQSKASGKPVAWFVPRIDGSPMDRKLVLEKYLLAGPFMMPDVVEILSRDFVPLRLAGVPAIHRVYGLEPGTFIEPGLVFLDGDLKVLHRLDRFTTFSEPWIAHLLRGVLKKAGRPVPPEKKIELSEAFAALYEGKPDPALFEKLPGDAERWYHGVALHLVNRDAEGRAEWKKIKSGRWAWKAAAELARDGPFVRGFEIYEWPPPEALALKDELPTTSTLPRAKADVPRALRFLRQMQRADGGWDDSQYNYGGDDSLPNVYTAVTALAALALRLWEPANPAIARAESYLRDETKVAERDQDELVWAHAYRLIYFAKSGDKPMTARLVKKLVDLQKDSGTWRHEYDNPFVTATVLHAFEEARIAGVEVPEGAKKRGAAALLSTRDPKGIFSYEFPGRGGAVQGAAGRMPYLEWTLSFSGQANATTLRVALDESFAHHALLERIRKYDDHADAFHNGGFFFWYDQLGRALAAKAIKLAPSLEKQREIVLSIPEFDGCWVDSHELGRVYGTAMALITLRLCEP